jgi:AraC-like DNA-binding protein
MGVMPLREWSTETVDPRQQRAFWREAVCEAVLNVSTEFPEPGFRGRIACSEYGELRFAAFESSGHEILRRRSHIAQSDSAHFLVSLQRRGQCRITQAEQDCRLAPGDIGIVDGMRPFRVDFPEPVERLLAVIPHRQLYARAPWLRRRPLNRIARDTDLGGALRFYLQRLAEGGCASEAEAGALAENVCNLIALTTARTGAERAEATADEAADLDRMIAVLRGRLADPDLSPGWLAAALGVSVRTVHKRFEAAETSFGRWVLERRLEACRRALQDPAQDRHSVSEIAFGWGFNDVSHFSRAFKTRYGLPPARFRRARLSTPHG